MMFKKSILTVIACMTLAGTLSAQNNVIDYARLKAEGRLGEVTPEQWQAYRNSLTPTVIDINTPQPTRGSVPFKANSCDNWVYSLPGAIPQLLDIDDWPPVRVNLPFNFCFYGQNYSTVHITANGTLSFAPFDAVNTGFTAAGFPLASTAFTDNRLIAPFWADVDFGGAASTGRLYYELTNSALIVTWENVGYYNEQHDKKNSFQVIITDGNDPLVPNGNNVRFNYKDMQWTTGSASGGTNGFGGTPANVGINRGDGINFVQIGRFDHAGIDYDGPFGVNDGISFLDNKTFDFNTCPPNSLTNIPPVALRTNNCDTNYVCNNDTIFFEYEFIAPENGQVCRTFIESIGSLGSSQLVITQRDTALIAKVRGYLIGRGGPDTVTVRFGAVDTLTGSTTFVGDTSYFDLVVVISTPKTPVIVGPKTLCFGQPIVLTTDTTYNEYLWSPGMQTTQSIVVTTPGTYQVKVTLNGCETTSAPHTVGTANAQVANILGNLFYCFNDSTNLIAENPLALKQIWWNGANYNFINIKAGVGQNILTVIDTNGCSSADTVVVKGGGTPVQINGLKKFCKGESLELYATPPATAVLDSFIWRFNGTKVSDTDTVVVTNSGQLTLVLVDNNGCISHDTVQVIASEIPVASFTTNPDQYTFEGKDVAASTTTQQSTLPIKTYAWSVNNASMGEGKNVTLTGFNTSGAYIVTHTVTDEAGCTGTAEKTIYVLAEPSNVITPNNDNLNETLVIPFAQNVKGTKLQVFNRWGNSVYEQDDYQNNWNASDLSDGVYFYVFTLPGDQIFKGSVTIIK